MNKKLTLLLDEDIVNNAKKYSKIHKKSLSKMVEVYFFKLSLKNIISSFHAFNCVSSFKMES